MVIEVNPVVLQAAASRHGLHPLLLTAMIEVESEGNPWAWNPEPHYRWFWDVKQHRPFRTVSETEIRAERPPADFYCLAGDPDQEWWAQQASWGLMQVMGAVARERGYMAPYLPSLCDPAANLDYACRHLSVLRGRYVQAYGWPGVIAAYNAGSPRRAGDGSFENQDYVDKVMAKLSGVTL